MGNRTNPLMRDAAMGHLKTILAANLMEKTFTDVLFWDVLSTLAGHRAGQSAPLESSYPSQRPDMTGVGGFPTNCWLAKRHRS